MTRDDINDIVNAVCPNDADFEEACISPAYLKKELEALALDQAPSSDAIDREDLKKWLDMNFSFGGALRKLEMFDRIDKELPPVTPTRKKGKWIEEPNSWLRCSCCNSHHPYTSIYAIRGSNYCPECGAEMEDEE